MTTILLIDDDESMREMLCDILQGAGFWTITASDGSEGMQLTEKHLPDLVILDLNLPYLDGFQILRNVRTTPRLSSIPVIIYTAETGFQTMRKGMMEGAQDYLLKPMPPRDLLAAVNVQLQQRANLEEKHNTTLRLLRKNIIYALPHELRTPLHLISGYAHLLELDDVRSSPDNILQYAASISAASARLERMIENYLIYAQVELINTDPSELQAARNHIVKDYATITKAAAAQIAQAYDREDDLYLDLFPLALRISEFDLKKIIMELADNAFKFSTAGSPVVIHSTREEELLLIHITDQGRGMTQEEIKLLDAYMQFGRELYEQQGSGLGFAVAKRLIQLHEGAINIESEPNRGTLVSIRFLAS